MVRTLALIVFVAAVFASYHRNVADANELRLADQQQCERGNPVRKLLHVTAESQLADIKAAAALATNPSLRLQYQLLVEKTEQIVNDPIIQSKLELIDCSKIH